MSEPEQLSVSNPQEDEELARRATQKPRKTWSRKLKVMVSAPVGTVSGRHTGKAPLIRKMKLSHPELSEVQIARHVGCDKANVHRVLARFLGKYTEQDLRDFQANRADVHDSMQMRFIESITDEQIDKTPVLSRVTAAAIHFDKSRLERGQATQIDVHMLIDAVEVIRELRTKET